MPVITISSKDFEKRPYFFRRGGNLFGAGGSPQMGYYTVGTKVGAAVLNFNKTASAGYRR